MKLRGFWRTTSMRVRVGMAVVANLLSNRSKIRAWWETPVLNSSRLTTLFSIQPASESGPSSFMVSVLAHGVFFLVLISLKVTPKIEARPQAERYTVRILKLHTMDSQIHWSAGNGVAHPDAAPAMHAAQTGGQPAAPAIPQHAVQQTLARFTLLQPNVPLNTLLPLETPIPLVVMVASEKIPAPKIV